jgi:hypothetical protein
MVDAKSRRAAIDARARTRYRRLMRKGDRRQDHEQDAKRQGRRNNELLHWVMLLSEKRFQEESNHCFEGMPHAARQFDRPVLRQHDNFTQACRLRLRQLGSALGGFDAGY